MKSLLDHPMVTHEQWDTFTETDHNTWQTLFKRQSALLKNRAAKEIIQGMEQLNICDHQIPKFSDLNKILKRETNFSVVSVKGLIPEGLFFQFLAKRIFPSTCFIRKPEEMDYLEEPDIFHDVFGHVPLLVNPIFADFMQQFGEQSIKAIELGMVEYAARLYWFTVEFGLIRSGDKCQIYGAGITSSKGESVYSLESDIPVRVKFNKYRAMKTQYHTDSFQKTYFVVEDFQQVFDVLSTLDWAAEREMCLSLPDIEQGVVINQSERV